MGERRRGRFQVGERHRGGGIRAIGRGTGTRCWRRCGGGLKHAHSVTHARHKDDIASDGHRAGVSFVRRHAVDCGEDVAHRLKDTDFVLPFRHNVYFGADGRHAGGRRTRMVIPGGKPGICWSFGVNVRLGLNAAIACRPRALGDVDDGEGRARGLENANIALAMRREVDVCAEDQCASVPPVGPAFGGGADGRQR